MEGHVKALQPNPKEQVCLSPEPRTASKGFFRSFLCLSNCFGKDIFFQLIQTNTSAHVFPKAFQVGFLCKAVQARKGKGVQTPWRAENVSSGLHLFLTLSRKECYFPFGCRNVCSCHLCKTPPNACPSCLSTQNPQKYYVLYRALMHHLDEILSYDTSQLFP